LDLSPRNVARRRSVTLLTLIPIAVTLMPPISAIMNFFADSLERVGCYTCTSVIFLLLTKFLRNTSHLFMIILPNDYLTIVTFFPKFILGSFEDCAPVVALVMLMRDVSCSFSKTFAV